MAKDKRKRVVQVRRRRPKSASGVQRNSKAGATTKTPEDTVAGHSRSKMVVLADRQAEPTQPAEDTTSFPKKRAAARTTTRKGVKKSESTAKAAAAAAPKRATKQPAKRKSKRKATPKRKRATGKRGKQAGAATMSKADAGQRQRDATARYRDAASRAQRDIAPLDISCIDWELREACKFDLKLFAETILPEVFYLGWSQDQLRCIRKIESVFLDDALFSLAMPRGGGKTALCRAGMLWGTAYAHKRFPFFIGASDPKAQQTLEFVKMYWYRNTRLRHLFPEIGYPVFRLENRYHLARGQTFHGEPTFCEWGTGEVQYPCLLLSKEIADAYWQRDPDSMLCKRDSTTELFEFNGRYVTANSGIMIGTAGIGGSIRGEAEVHPVTLAQPRPDVVLLDDVQKDQVAESPTSVGKVITLIDGAISGLAGPGKTIAGLMPCTVICEGDASDTYLDDQKKPEWKGERCRMVLSWPDGITDFEITMDSEAGRLWNDYAEERRKSLRLYGDNRLGTILYHEHRSVMDAGFVCSWADRYDKDPLVFKDKDGEPTTWTPEQPLSGIDTDQWNEHQMPKELSAQQHAMNLRLLSPKTFPAEYQNIGRRDYVANNVMITSGQMMQKVLTGLKRSQVPQNANCVTAFLDIQNEVLFYTILAVDMEFTGAFIEYGTYPTIGSRYFTKRQIDGWNLLTKSFFEAYPDQRKNAIRTDAGRIRAPLEAKIYHAVDCAQRWLLSRSFTRHDGTEHRISRLGIDIRWGQVSEVLKRLIRDVRRPEIIPYQGQAFPPTNRQLEEYTRTAGWMFEDEMNPRAKEVKWVIRPNQDGMFYMSADVNRGKDFLMARLGSPHGTSGSIALHDGDSESHELFAYHVCESEYPELVEARGLKKNMWMERDGKPDNDWLDTSVGCLMMASRQGATIRTEKEDGQVTKRSRSLGAKARAKRQQRRALV